MPVGGMKSSGVEDKNSSSEAKPKLGNASEASASPTPAVFKEISPVSKIKTGVERSAAPFKIKSSQSCP